MRALGAIPIPATLGSWFGRGAAERALAASELFDEIARSELRNDQRLPRGGLVERVASTSFIAALPDDERERVLRETEQIEASLPDPIVLPHVTELFAYARR